MDDTQLLREYADKGSETAFARLVELHLDLVYSAALRRVGGDHHRAEEVTQMVFTDLARKASQLKNHPLLAGWLHRSTRWAAAGLRRAEQRRTANEKAAAQEPFRATATEPPADWAQLAPLLDAALDSLSAKDRDAVLLRFFHDRPFAEIGVTLGLSENAARMRVERALSKLHSLLVKRGTSSTAAALGLALVQNAISAAPSGTASLITATSLGNAAATGCGSFFAYFLMTKLQLTLVGAAIALAIGLSMQTTKNHRLQDQLTGLQTQLETSRVATTKIHAQIAQIEATLKHLDNAIATQTPPLTPEQQERVRLDTIIRKGELDSEYAALFRRLKLAPEPLDKLKVLIVERNQAIYDAVKLAKNQGVEPATPSEERTIGESATTEIDQRIAGLLGTKGYSQFHEYVELQPYRMWATSLAGLEQNPGSIGQSVLANPALDEKSDKLAQLLAKTAPSYLDEQYRANGWPIDPPTEFREALAKILSPEAMQRYDENTASNAQRRRMYEIAREAAIQGKLKLSKSSARDYPAPNQNQSSSAK